MRKETVKTQKKEAKSVEKVKRKSGKQGDLKKVGAAAIKKLVAATKLPPEQQSADATTIAPPAESYVPQDGTGLVEVVAMKATEITELPPEPQVTDTNIKIPQTESKVLRERLGLIGYISETIKLASSIDILGCKAEGVVFAKRIAEKDSAEIDRVLLHVTLVSATGKRSIVSSRKKVSLPEWQAVTEALTGMSITWRDKELKRAAK